MMHQVPNVAQLSTNGHLIVSCIPFVSEADRHIYIQQ